MDMTCLKLYLLIKLTNRVSNGILKKSQNVALAQFILVGRHSMKKHHNPTLGDESIPFLS